MLQARAIVLAGLGAVTLTGAAVAASRNSHIMNVPLSDGSTATIEYVGDVPPKVTIKPAPLAGMMDPFGIFVPNFADVQRQLDAAMRQMANVASGTSTAPGMNLAALGNAPPGAATSVTVVTTSNGRSTCTRTTEVTSAGPGKPPKVVSDVSGDCGAASAPAPEKPTT